MDTISRKESENTDQPDVMDNVACAGKTVSVHVRPSPRFFTILVCPLLVFGVTGVVYLSCLSNHLTEDSVSYALKAITGEGLLHPHHLLYNPLLRVVVMVLHGAPIGTLITALQLTNIAFTMMAVVMFCLVTRYIGAPRWASVIYSLFFALSSGILTYSSQIEVYNITILFLLLAVFGLVRRGRSIWSLFLVGAGWSAAMLFHQTAVFFGVAIVVHELMRAGGHSVRRLVGIVGLPLIAVGMLYLVAGWFVGCRNLLEYWHWMTSSAHVGYWGKGSLSITTIVGALGGMVRALIGTEPKILFILLFFLLGFHVSGQLLADFRHMVRNRTIIIACLAWFVLQAIFNGWWYAENPEFWISTIIPLALIVTAIAHSLNCPAPRTILQSIVHIPIIAVTILMVLSAWGHYQTNKGENLNKLRVEQCAGYVRTQDTIVTAGTDLQQYCRLYVRRSRIIAINSNLAEYAVSLSDSATFTQALLDALALEVRQAQQRGGTLFVDQRIVQSNLSATRRMKDFDSEEFYSGLARQFKVIQVKSDTESLWSVLAFPTIKATVTGPDAEQGASADADKPRR